MSYKEFWEDDPTIAKSYYEAYKIKMKREQEIKEWQMWKQGVYMYEALCDVSPILHAFSKKGTKPLPYPDKPYGFEEPEKTEQQKEQEKQNEIMKAQVFFNNWAKAAQNRFKKEGGVEKDGRTNTR